MKLSKLAAASLLTFAAMGSAQAQTLTINIINLTQGMYFTPRLVIAHNNTMMHLSLEQTHQPPWLGWPKRV